MQENDVPNVINSLNECLNDWRRLRDGAGTVAKH
jgi:hypothetical protein